MPAPATAVASAIRNHAETSLSAAADSASVPSGRRSIRRSEMIRASTGNAVTDIDTAMNSANARKRVFGPSTVNSGSAAAMPSISGNSRLVLEIASVIPMRPRSCEKSTSRPIRNM